MSSESGVSLTVIISKFYPVDKSMIEKQHDLGKGESLDSKHRYRNAGVSQPLVARIV